MSNNKDMKEELHKLCDSFFQCEDEEKLSKELKDNLEKFFKVIKDKYGKNFHLNDDDGANKFLKEFSPWHQERGEKLIKDFVEIVNQNSTEDFSWLDILEEDEQWKKSWEKSNEEVKIKEEVTDKNKHVNMRYQIPTHFHGDIDNAVIFHCMENPRGYLGSYGDNQIDGGLGETDLHGYYDKSYKLLTEDNSKRKTIKKIKSVLKKSSKIKPIQEIIQERYQLEGDANKDISEDQIKNIIYSNHESALRREIEHMYKIENKEFCNFDFENKGELSKTVLLKDYYYLKEYYSQLIQTNKKLDFKKLKNEKKAVKKIADKICNVEIYPFSCAQPNLGGNGIGRKILFNSDLSRLGAYIVLRRIYKYLLKYDQSKTNNEEEPQKPVFVFRKYDRAWEGLFNSIFKEAEKEENNDGFQNEQTLKNLEKLFFYCQTGQQGGGITSGNVISIKNYKIYKDIFENLKQTAFKEISSLLPRIEVDKKTKNK